MIGRTLAVRPSRVAAAMLSIFLSAILCGCSMGPRNVQGNRLDYNITLQKSNCEELLLNLVRSRYSEPLFFLQVGSISSSFGYSANLGAGAVLSGDLRAAAQAGQMYSPTIGAGYSESPTITYTPLQGEKAVRQLQSEIKLDRFFVLTRLGWGIEALMWLAVGQIGDLQNYTVSYRTGESVGAGYDRFFELTAHLGKMQMRGDLELISLGKKDEGEADSLTMQLRYADAGEADRIEDLLGIRPERRALAGGRVVSTIELTTVRDLASPGREQEKKNAARVPIRLKSFFEMLFDLALHVDVPEDEEERRIVRPFRKPSLDKTARRGLHAGLIRVGSSSAKPADAFAFISYRNRWFYIADEDLVSKAYFILVGSIFSLQSGDLQTAGPLLTLPVGR